tara:strand:- start:122 stop:322 length:201 start_codon:yes stop_codon:yes gene_type:complete
MYTIDETIDIIMDSDCNDLTVGDCFDEYELVDIINDLTDKRIIGDDDNDDIFYDDFDIDIIIDNLN